MLRPTRVDRLGHVAVIAAAGCLRDDWALVPRRDASADDTFEDARDASPIADETEVCDVESACGYRSGQPRCGVTCTDGLRNLYRGEGDTRDGVGSHHATQGNASFAEGRVGQAFAFGGYNAMQYVTLPPEVIDFGDEDFTVSFWFASMRNGNLLSKRSVCWGVRVYAGLDVRLTYSGELLTELWTSARPSPYLHRSSPGLNDGAWHHVAIVRDGQTLRLSVDGAAIWTESVNGTLSDPANTPVYLGVGRCVPGAPGSNGTQDGSTWFDGRIDEVAFLSRALSETETLAVAQGRCAL